MENNESSVVLKVHPNFYKRIKEFIDNYEELHGIRISVNQATKIIDDKIEWIGGLKPPKK